MKDRKYYERLISAELDGDISPSERLELDRQLKQDSELKEFRDDLLTQRKLLQSLPDQSNPQLKQLPQGPNNRKSVVTRLWRSKLTLPAPVASAAAILLFVAGLLMAGSSGEQHKASREIVQKSKVVLYESDQLEPATSYPVKSSESQIN